MKSDIELMNIFYLLLHKSQDMMHLKNSHQKSTKE